MEHCVLKKEYAKGSELWQTATKTEYLPLSVPPQAAKQPLPFGWQSSLTAR